MKNKFFPNTILQSILVLLIVIIYSAIAVSILKKFIPDIGLKITLTFVFCMLMTILTLYIINIKRNIVFDYKIKKINFSTSILSIFTLIFFSFSFNTPLNRLIYELGLNDVSNPENPFNSFLFVLSTVILAPILEEIIFRRFIMGGLLTNYSVKKSIIVSTILFSLIHISPPQIIGAIFYGAYFGFIYYKTKSIILPILLHFTANISGLAGVYLNYKYGQVPIQRISDIYGSYSVYIILTSLTFFFLLTYLLKKNIRENYE